MMATRAEITLAVFEDLHPSSAKSLWVNVATDLAAELRQALELLEATTAGSQDSEPPMDVFQAKAARESVTLQHVGGLRPRRSGDLEEDRAGVREAGVQPLMPEPTYINKRLDEIQKEWATMSLEERLKHAPQRILIFPESFDAPQRIEASARATEMGRGLLMEIHSSHTEFYAIEGVPVGKVEVHASRTYKGMLEYVATLESPETTFGYEELHAWMSDRGRSEEA